MYIIEIWHQRLHNTAKNTPNIMPKNVLKIKQDPEYKEKVKQQALAINYQMKELKMNSSIVIS